MSIQLLDGNNVFMGIAQSLAADPKSADACYQIDGVRRLITAYINRHIKAGKKVVVAVDSWSWRKTFFPAYKHRRYEDRKEKKETFKHDVFIALMQQVLDELREHSPAVIIRVPGAEGDDVVAAIATVFGPEVGVDIHSRDHDLLQLQLLHQGIRQFNPMTWKWMMAEMEGYSLIDHIIRGDSGDGVPNILSPDDCFVTRTRQTVMTAKRYAECLDILKAENPEERMDDEMRARYTRNRTLIDLREVPDDLIIDIFAAYESEEARQREVGAYTRYLTSHGIL